MSEMLHHNTQDMNFQDPEVLRSEERRVGKEC